MSLDMSWFVVNVLSCISISVYGLGLAYKSREDYYV